MCADPEVMRYVADRGVLTREDAWRQLAMLAGHWQLRGFGTWAVEERTTGASSDAARAALGEAFGRLGWPRVVSLIDPANARSVRLAERLGERLAGQATVRGHRVTVFALDSSAWSGTPATAER
jgi:RimJ/RimL family protein N-acetyltransferase